MTPEPLHPRAPLHTRPIVRGRTLRRGRLRRRARPDRGWLLVGLGAALLFAGLARGESASTNDAATVTVAVATRDLEPGAVLDASTLSWQVVPSTDAGPRAITDERDAIGRTVTAPIEAGEPISRRRVAPEGVHGPAALVPEGSVALAVPRDERTPPVEIGQRIEVLRGARDLATVDLTSGSTSPSSGSDHLVARGPVVAVDEQQVVVAVPRAESGRVAAALLDGAVVLALSGAA